MDVVYLTFFIISSDYKSERISKMFGRCRHDGPEKCRMFVGDFFFFLDQQYS